METKTNTHNEATKIIKFHTKEITKLKQNKPHIYVGENECSYILLNKITGEMLKITVDHTNSSDGFTIYKDLGRVYLGEIIERNEIAMKFNLYLDSKKTKLDFQYKGLIFNWGY